MNEAGGIKIRGAFGLDWRATLVNQVTAWGTVNLAKGDFLTSEKRFNAHTAGGTTRPSGKDLYRKSLCRPRLRDTHRRPSSGAPPMLEFCSERGITADIKLIRIQQINEAYERLLKSDVKYRFVIDTASLR